MNNYQQKVFVAERSTVNGCRAMQHSELIKLHYFPDGQIFLSKGLASFAEKVYFCNRIPVGKDDEALTYDFDNERGCDDLAGVLTRFVGFKTMRMTGNDKGLRDAYVRLHLSILLAGCTGLFGRLISLGELPLVWYRVLIGSLVLMAVLLFSGELKMPSRRDLLSIAGCGLLLSVHWVFFYGSIKAANVSVGVVCFASVGFFTAILEPCISRCRPSWHEVLLGLLTLSGIMLIFGLDARYRYGIVLGVVSSVLYSLFSISSKRVQASSAASSSTMLLYELLGGLALLSVAMPVYHGLFPEAAVVPQGRDWWLLPLFASVFTVLPFLLQLQSLRRISAFTVNLSYNLEPVYSIILAALIFHEAQEMNGSFWLGITLIVVSVAVQSLRKIKA